MEIYSKTEYRLGGNWTWRMWREGKLISGKGDYILGTRYNYFYNVGIREPRIPIDHWVVLGELRGEGPMRHRRYFK